MDPEETNEHSAPSFAGGATSFLDLGLPDDVVLHILQLAGPGSLSALCALNKAHLQYITERERLLPPTWYRSGARVFAQCAQED